MPSNPIEKLIYFVVRNVAYCTNYDMLKKG